MSDQIVNDFLNYPEILQKIINNNGCCVDDIKLRSGRRFEPSNPNRHPNIKKPKLRDRIATLKAPSLHPDALEVYYSIANVPDDEIRRLFHVMEQAYEHIDDEAANDIDEED